MPNIFDKQDDIIKKKKTSGIRPYNFHQKISEQKEESEPRDLVEDAQRKIKENIEELKEPLSDPEVPLASIAATTPTISSEAQLAPTPLPSVDFINSKDNQVKPSLNPVKTQVKPRQNLGIESDEKKLLTRLKPSLNLGNSLTIKDSDKLNQVKPSFKSGQLSGQNLVKTELKPPSSFNMSRLVGLQKSVTLFLLDKTLEHRDGTSGPVSANDISTSCKTSLEGARTTIKELIKKGVIHRTSFKEGRGGWSQYHLTDYVYQTLIAEQVKFKPSLNLGKTELKPGVESGLEPGQSAPSVSSKILNTTTGQPKAERGPDKKELPPDWQSIDFSGLSSIGFRPCHLMQIFESGKSHPEMVQESIYELEHDLKSGTHGMRSPLLILLKQLRVKGEPYTAVKPGYLSDEMRYEQNRLEELKRRQAELARIRAEQQEIENHAENEFEESQFQIWVKSKTQNEIKAIVGSFSPTLPGGIAMLRTAFRKEREQIRSQIDQSLNQ